MFVSMRAFEDLPFLTCWGRGTHQAPSGMGGQSVCMDCRRFQNAPLNKEKNDAVSSFNLCTIMSPLDLFMAQQGNEWAGLWCMLTGKRKGTLFIYWESKKYWIFQSFRSFKWNRYIRITITRQMLLLTTFQCLPFIYLSRVLSFTLKNIPCSVDRLGLWWRFKNPLTCKFLMAGVSCIRGHCCLHFAGEGYSHFAGLLIICSGLA